MALLADYRFNRNACDEVWTEPEHHYAILIDRANAIAILDVVITWVAWYDVYFWLSEEEFELFETDLTAFSKLTYSYAADKGERLFRHKLLKHCGPGGDQLEPAAPQTLEALRARRRPDRG